MIKRNEQNITVISDGVLTETYLINSGKTISLYSLSPDKNTNIMNKELVKYNNEIYLVEITSTKRILVPLAKDEFRLNYYREINELFLNISNDAISIKEEYKTSSNINTPENVSASESNNWDTWG